MYLNSPSIVYRHTQWTFISTCVNSDMTLVVEGSHKGKCVYSILFWGGPHYLKTSHWQRDRGSWKRRERKD